MTSLRKRVLFACILGVCLAAASPALAHAVLEQSNPPADATLNTPPHQVDLQFTESVDPTFSSVTVLDRSGKQVSERPTFSPDRRSITVPLANVSAGVYSVKWRVLSAADGHVTTGVFAFAVGLALQPGSGAQTATPSLVLVDVRWIVFLAATLLTGSAFFRLAVLQPGLNAVAQSDRRTLEAAADRRLRMLAVMAGSVLLAGIAAQVALQAGTLLDAPLSRVIASGMFWTLLGRTKLGWSAVTQTGMTVLLLLPSSDAGRVVQAAAMVLAVGVASLVTLTSSIHVLPLALVVLAALAYGLLSVKDRSPKAVWAPAVAAAGLLGGFTIASHAAGSGPLAIGADLIHLLAAALWTGGLASLLLVLGTAESTHRNVLAQALVPRFSAAAGIALGVLVITGVYSAWLHVPALRAFVSTAYGRTLFVKLALIVPLAALGTINRFVMRPRLDMAGASGSPASLRWFQRLIGGEVFVASAVLLAVAVLTITPPARVTLPAPAAAQTQLQLAGVAEDVQIALTITPALQGWNRFEVVVTEPGGRPLAPDARVLLRLTKLDEDVDPTTIPAHGEGSGRYVAEGGELVVPGRWEVEVRVRRLGRLDVSTSFPLRLGEGPSPTSDPAAQRLLEQARAVATRLHAWREVQQFADGEGGVAFARFEFVAPDRMRYQTSDGTEAIIVGTTRYLRDGAGPWERDTIARLRAVEGPLQYMRDARGVVRGRQARCGEEACQVVLWEWDPAITLAGWIGMESHRTYKVLMAAPSHFMTLQFSDFNAPLRIVAPQ